MRARRLIKGLDGFARSWSSEAGCSEALALVLALGVRIDDFEPLRSQPLIAVPDLDGPFTRHQLKAVLQGVGDIIYLPDLALQCELILDYRR